MSYEIENPINESSRNNNTRANADRLVNGTAMIGNLGSATDLDYFVVTTDSAGLIKLDFSTELLSTLKYFKVRVLDANGDLLQTTAASVGGTPLVNGTSQSGTSLTIDGIENLPEPGTLFHFATSGEDTTAYTVVSTTALSGGGTTLTLDKALPAGLADNTALVFDSARLLTGVSGSITAVAPSAGSYYVLVSVGDVYSSSAYELVASVQSTVESEGTSGNGSATASAQENLVLAVDANNRLLENVFMTGALSSASDVDCWVFTTAVSTDFDITFASSSTNTADEWIIEITDASGAVLSGGSLTAGTSATLNVDKATFPTGQTFMVKVSATSASVYNTGSYTLKVSGDELDLNDAPVLTVGGVSGAIPNLPIDSGVTRSIAEGNTDGVALSDWFSASDPDAGQTVAFYRLSLTKTSGSSDAVIEVGSGSSLKSYGFAAGATSSGNVLLTAAEMATAVFKPGTTAAGQSFTLALQAYDSTGTFSAPEGADSSGASAIIKQSIQVVSANAGITADTTLTKFSLSENAKGEGADKPHSTSFTLVLTEAPGADVKVYLLDPNNQLDFTVDGTAGELVTFSSQNWGTAQTVTVSASTDSTAESSQTGTVSFTVVSADATYDGFSVSPLSFAIFDNAAPVMTQPGTISYTDTSATDTFTASEGTLAATDANGDTISYGITGGSVSAGISTATNAFGTLAVNTSTGAYTFTPSASGINAAATQVSETFTVTASDGSLPVSKTLTISVAGVNDKPAGTATTPTVLTESSGASNSTAGTLTASSKLTLTDAEASSSASVDAAKLLEALWTASSNGATYSKVGTYGTATLTLGTSTVSYALNDNDVDTQALKAGATAQDIFSIPIKDSAGLTDTVAVSFSIKGANDYPTITAIGDQSAAIGSTFTYALASQVSDPEGDSVALTVALEGGGNLPQWLSYDAASKTLSGTPSREDEGTLVLQLTASDGSGSTESFFNLFVLNTALEALLSADVAIASEDEIVSGNVLDNDTPASGIPLLVETYSVGGSAEIAAGELTTVDGVGTFVLDADGAYTFTPALDYSGGVPQVTYVTNLEQGSSTLDITVTAVDDASVLVADRAQLSAGVTVTGNVLSNDSDVDSTLSVASFVIAGDTTSYVAGDSVVLSEKGSFTLAGNGSYSFVPTGDFQGSVPQITYTTNTGASSTLNISGGVDVTVQAYHWSSHFLLPATSVVLGASLNAATNQQGRAVFEAVSDESVTVSLIRDLESEAAAVNASVNLVDAIAILKMIVGLPVNSGGNALSPYQALAADFDGNGVVQLTDAIGVLKHVVGLQAPEPEWRFVDELQSGLATGLNVGQVPPIERDVDLGAGSLHVGVVAYIVGDVDGSFAAPAGTETLTTTYFSELVAEHPSLSLSQFGIYS